MLHPIQSKLLNIIEKINLKTNSLRQVGKLIDVDHPQKILHHIEQLEKKGIIKIDKRNGKIKRIRKEKIQKSNFVVIPILGAANCGDANIFADEYLDGYLKVSKSIIDDNKNIFAIKASGNSMNKADIKKKNIEDGDYVIIDGEKRNPKSGDYVLSIIDEMANIKKLFVNIDETISLMSESTEKHPTIIIHQDDKFMINGIVKNVIKKPKIS